MFILKYKKIFLGISSILVLASIVLIMIHGLKFGVEFTGGSVLEFSTETKIEETLLKERLDTQMKDSYTLRTSGESGYVLKTKVLSDEEKNQMIALLSDNAPQTIQVIQFNTVGPTLGNELKGKAILSLILVIISITLFIAYAFRHVSKPVSSWRYGIITMIALVHDVVITIGVFAYLGATIGTEIDSLFLTALLVILGYSINDTIVVFDRIRENLLTASEEEREEKFDTIVGESLSQTFVRSMNTSITTLISLVIILFLTTGSLFNFALALMIGIVSGTYSSLFVASPLLTYFKPKKTE